jgi:hypothetical protein
MESLIDLRIGDNDLLLLSKLCGSLCVLLCLCGSLHLVGMNLLEDLCSLLIVVLLGHCHLL